MTVSQLINTMSFISDSCVNEFADKEKNRRKTVARKMLVRVTSAAVCILAAIFAIHTIMGTMNGLQQDNNYDHSDAATPFVKLNDEIYYFSGIHEKEIPDKYHVVGKIGEGVSKKGSYKYGESNGCHKDELIFMSDDNPDELYVYSTLFAWDGYLFTKFVRYQN